MLVAHVGETNDGTKRTLAADAGDKCVKLHITKAIRANEHPVEFARRSGAWKWRPSFSFAVSVSFFLPGVLIWLRWEPAEEQEMEAHRRLLPQSRDERIRRPV